MRRKRLLDEEILTDNLYQQNREEKLEMLADPDMAEFLAKEQAMSVKEYKIRMVNSIRINQTKRIFRRFQHRLIRLEDWEGFKQETKELFFLPSVRKRWEQFRLVANFDFRNYIDKEIFPEIQSPKINPDETNINSIHTQL